MRVLGVVGFCLSVALFVVAEGCGGQSHGDDDDSSTRSGGMSGVGDPQESKGGAPSSGAPGANAGIAGSGAQGVTAGHGGQSDGGATSSHGGTAGGGGAAAQGGALGNAGQGGEASQGGGGGEESTPAGICGDGELAAGEACDDGNAEDGDGCSATCSVEAGHICNAARCDPDGTHCSYTLAATFRDFNASTATGGHPDFQPGYASDGAIQGLVQELLDADGKPVQSTKATTSATGGFMHGQTAFAQWYRDAPPSSKPIAGEIVLWDDGTGRFTNRWGAHGEQWHGALTPNDYGVVTLGGPGGTGCEYCTPTATGMCYDPCIPFGSASACCAEIPTPKVFDGNPLFFPIDSAPGILSEPRFEGKVPAQYGWSGWPDETDMSPDYDPPVPVDAPIETATAPFPSTTHNFSFTTEVTYWFTYAADMNAIFEFTGDDDLWVFLNGHLAVDMGSWHVPTNGTLTIAGDQITATAQLNVDDTGQATKTAPPKNGTAETYGLVSGNAYPIKVFHAERQAEGSSFRISIAGFDVGKSLCVAE